VEGQSSTNYSLSSSTSVFHSHMCRGGLSTEQTVLEVRLAASKLARDSEPCFAEMVLLGSEKRDPGSPLNINRWRLHI